MLFANKIKAIRADHQYTIERFALMFGVTRQTVLKWEKGECYPPYKTLEKMSKIFDFSIDNLLDQYLNSRNYQFKDVGKRSYKSIITRSLFMIGFAILAGWLYYQYLVTNHQIFLMVSAELMLVVALLILFVVDLLIRPRILIKINDFGITLCYIHHKEIVLSFESLDSVKVNGVKTRRQWVSFGAIRFQCEFEKYWVYGVKDIHDVYEDIMTRRELLFRATDQELGRDQKIKKPL